MVGIKIMKNLWNNSFQFWNNCKFWNVPNVNCSGIVPRIVPNFWNNLNCSRFFKLFQTAKNSGLQTGQIVPGKVPSRVRVRAINTRARYYMEKYIPKGYIYFSNVIRSGTIRIVPKIPSEKLQRFVLTPYGALAVIFPQGIF